MLAGAMVTGRRTPPEIQIGIGWVALCIVLTAWGVLVPFSLAIPATAFVFLSLCVMGLRNRPPSLNTRRTFGRVVIVTLVFRLVVAPIQPSSPDTPLHLLPDH